MRRFKEAMETTVASILVAISIPFGLLFMVAVLALPFVAVGLGIAIAVKSFAVIVGWAA